MATVATPTRKINKAFFCTIYDQNGVLAKIDNQITFFREADGAIIDYEPEMAPWTCILGEVGLAQAQAIADKRHGGAARIACTRAQEAA